MGNNNPGTPVVSIVMPTHNRKKLLEKAIESVIEQSFTSWELLVVDDGSKDGTEQMMNELSQKDERIKYCITDKSPFPGISYYLNYGIRISRGKYIARIDDDDYWRYKDKLKDQVNFLENNEDYVLVGGGIVLVDDEGKEIYRYFKKEHDSDIRKKALLSNPFTHTTVMFRKEAAQRLDLYAPLKFAEDWDLWLRLGQVGKLYNIREYFTCYLSAGQNTSFKRQREQSKLLFSIIRKYKDSYNNYYKGFLLNTVQYIYSFTPDFIKQKFHSFLIFFKRNYF